MPRETASMVSSPLDQNILSPCPEDVLGKKVVMLKESGIDSTSLSRQA